MISATSSPMGLSAPPQSGQVQAVACVTVSRGRCAGRARRAGLIGAGSGAGSAAAAGLASSLWLASSSSRLSSSCAIFSSSCSEERPNCMRLSRASSMRSFSISTSRESSVARVVSMIARCSVTRRWRVSMSSGRSCRLDMHGILHASIA